MSHLPSGDNRTALGGSTALPRALPSLRSHRLGCVLMTHRNPALRHLETEPWASAPPPPVAPHPPRAALSKRLTEEPGALRESLPVPAPFWRKCSDQNKGKMTVAGWGTLAGGGTWPGWHGPRGHCTHVRETAGAQIGKKGSRGVALQKAVCHSSLPARFGAREKHYWRQSWQAPQLAASVGVRGQRKSGRSVTQPDV